MKELIPDIDDIKYGINNPRVGLPYVWSDVMMAPIRNCMVKWSFGTDSGTHVLDKDWDVLIILDSCRVDAIQSIVNEYEFIDNIGQIWSVGGSSMEWMARTFSKDYSSKLSKTAYLTANPWSERVLERSENNRKYKHTGMIRLKKYGNINTIDTEDLLYYETIWNYIKREDDVKKEFDLAQSYTPARYVTDRAITYARNNKFDRLILHYMQPHIPYIQQAMLEDRQPTEIERHPFSTLRKNNDKKSVYDVYLGELKCVVNEIEMIVRNMDANKVVITADHGEAFGEYGIDNHHTGSIHPKIRQVPWIELEAKDQQTYSPDNQFEVDYTEGIEERLSALGYT